MVPAAWQPWAPRRNFACQGGKQRFWDAGLGCLGCGFGRLAAWQGVLGGGKLFHRTNLDGPRVGRGLRLGLELSGLTFHRPHGPEEGVCGFSRLEGRGSGQGAFRGPGSPPWGLFLAGPEAGR
jgi:hypothetical protein